MSKLLNSKLYLGGLLICLYLIFFNSCNKENIQFSSSKDAIKNTLTGDTAIFIGTWDWCFTDHFYGWCQGDNYYELLTPGSVSCNFSVKFTESGMLYYFRNDTLISEYRILFNYFDFNSQVCLISNAKQFRIDPDGNENITLTGCVSNDTLVCGFEGFLFNAETGCESYSNYFVRQ